MDEMKTFTFQNNGDSIKTTIFLNKIFKICWFEDGDRAIVYFDFKDFNIVRQEVNGKSNVLALCAALGWEPK